MKNNNNLQLNTKGRILGLVVCFAAVVAVMGTISYNKFQSNLKEQLAQAEQEFNELNTKEIEAEKANTGDVINEAPEIYIITEEPEVEEANMNRVSSPQFSFTVDSTLLWPVDGGVLMRYSMDKSIYFETLDQYKRNDAMIISGEVGSQVLAAEYGQVTIIEDSVETGKTITVDMGNGYSAIYGQLADLKVTSGSVVEKGQILGSLAEPSRYYVVEGPNLYFKLVKDGEAIDPLEFLE